MEVKSWRLFVLARMLDNEKSRYVQIKLVVLGAIGCTNNADFEKKSVNDNIVLDELIICKKLGQEQVI